MGIKLSKSAGLQFEWKDILKDKKVKLVVFAITQIGFTMVEESL